VRCICARHENAEQNADHGAPLPRAPPCARHGERKQSQAADRETKREEGEERIDGHRVLDLDEGDAPDNGDENECDQRHRPSIVIARSHSRGAGGGAPLDPLFLLKRR
jgi:hypothetical protein